MTLHTICILGGTGFVGGHLVSRLARDGHRIKVLTRHRERHRDLLVLPTVEVVETAVYDVPTLQRHLRGCDTAINLVGILNEAGHDGKGFYRAHVELTQSLLDACRTSAVPRLLHMSALGADAARGASYYQRTKGEAENRAHSTHGVATTSFRPSVIFGPGDSFLNRFATLLRKVPLVFPLACPDARFAPVYVGDVVEAFSRALDDRRTIGGHYDLCGPHQYTLRQLVQYTARQLGLRRCIVGLGDAPSRWQAQLFEYLPGKPFSLDNYLSLREHNVCSGPFPEVFALQPTALEAVAPYYLRGSQQRYAGLRSRARRT